MTLRGPQGARWGETARITLAGRPQVLLRDLWPLATGICQALLLGLDSASPGPGLGQQDLLVSFQGLTICVPRAHGLALATTHTSTLQAHTQCMPAHARGPAAGAAGPQISQKTNKVSLCLWVIELGSFMVLYLIPLS